MIGRKKQENKTIIITLFSGTKKGGRDWPPFTLEQGGVIALLWWLVVERGAHGGIDDHGEGVTHGATVFLHRGCYALAKYSCPCL